jgi:hypothetical protein
MTLPLVVSSCKTPFPRGQCRNEPFSLRFWSSVPLFRTLIALWSMRTLCIFKIHPIIILTPPILAFIAAPNLLVAEKRSWLSPYVTMYYLAPAKCSSTALYSLAARWVGGEGGAEEPFYCNRECVCISTIHILFDPIFPFSNPFAFLHPVTSGHDRLLPLDSSVRWE